MPRENSMFDDDGFLHDLSVNMDSITNDTNKSLKDVLDSSEEQSSKSPGEELSDLESRRDNVEKEQQDKVLKHDELGERMREVMQEYNKKSPVVVAASNNSINPLVKATIRLLHAQLDIVAQTGANELADDLDNLNEKVNETSESFKKLKKNKDTATKASTKITHEIID